jgi:hypothetical protein
MHSFSGPGRIVISFPGRRESVHGRRTRSYFWICGDVIRASVIVFNVSDAEGSQYGGTLPCHRGPADAHDQREAEGEPRCAA